MPSVTPAHRSRQRLLDVLTPVVLTLGFDLEDVTVTAVGRRSVVRVIVDSDDGVDLDAVADVSRAISEILDAEGEDAFSRPYVLEVSSPGVDRPLREPRHWRRNVGRLVEVAVEGSARTARVIAVDDGGVVLADDAGEQHSGWNSLGEGKVQVEFSRKGGPEADDPDTDTDADIDTDDAADSEEG